MVFTSRDALSDSESKIPGGMMSFFSNNTQQPALTKFGK